MKLDALNVLLLGLAGAGCATTTSRLRLPPLQTVDHVDLQRYLGVWYEIALFPQSFEKGCTGTSATYSLRRDGDIEVVNRCHRGSLDGPVKVAKGRARVTDRASNAKLEVSFFWPFWGAYWIIDLDPGYQYAAVGHPSRDYLWILSRTPHLAPEVYDRLLERVKAQGYDLSRLQRTIQAGSPP